VVNFNDNLGILGNISRQDLSERDQQASRDAFQSFKQLVEQYPQSRYADDAQLRMNYITNSLAAYEVHVARYYFRRGAFVAAAYHSSCRPFAGRKPPAARGRSRCGSSARRPASATPRLPQRSSRQTDCDLRSPAA